MGYTSFSSRQFNNSIARQFFLNYDTTVAKTAGAVQSDGLLMFGFFQNKQSVIDANAWNAWILNDSRAGAAPASTDTYYPEYFNVDTENWRNKLMFLVPATLSTMVKKDASGTIQYNGQNWSAVTSWDEESVTAGSEHRYVYCEADLMYYDSGLAVCAGVTSKNIITGLGLYKAKLNGVTGLPNGVFDGTAWSSVNYDDSTYDYVYYTHPTINSKSTNTVYDKLVLGTSNLTFLYQDTFTSIVRSTTLHTKFSVIIEF